jgi:hypothetical protein
VSWKDSALLRAAATFALPIAFGAVAFGTPAIAASGQPDVGLFADQVNTLALTSYAASVTGVVQTSADAITIYQTSRNPAFYRAIKKFAGYGEVAITQKHVANSYASLESLTHRMAGDRSALATSGVTMRSWGPDPASGTVEVTLASPTGAGPSTMTTRAVSAADTTLSGRYGAGLITVSSTREPLAVTVTSRNSDASPWSAADGTITSFGGTCTLAWGTTGKASGNGYILSAGHCGPGEVDEDGTGAPKIGNVATQYYQPVSGSYVTYDFETIRANGRDRVWSSGSKSYTVLGAELPAEGTLMTVNGNTTGERTGNKVTNVGQCESEKDGHYGVSTVCDTGEAVGTSTICNGGDSGGPAYVRNSALTGAYAIGTITSASGKDCWYQLVVNELGEANLSLDVG